MNWNHGYNVDEGYTFGYYREMAPAWLDFCALLRGTRPPAALGVPALRYLELGCAQGNNLCLLAAQYPEMEFVGVDFNPLHIAHAQTLAADAGLGNVRFIEADFCALGRAWPADFGTFHYVAAHGIYSWIAPEVQRGLVDCIAHATAPGALVYLSYNAMPGWTAMIPTQHLLRLWQVRERLPSAKAVETGRQRMLELIEGGLGMARSLPGLRSRVEGFGKLERNYLIQEYLHDDWHPKWFDQVEAELAPSKLRFVCTATAGDWWLPSLLPAKEKAILAQYTDGVEREVMLDVLVNQSFRRDLWSRGSSPLWAGEQQERLLATAFALVQRPGPTTQGDKTGYAFTTSAGDVTGRETTYGPIYEALAVGPRSLRDLTRLPELSARPSAEVLQALGFMLHAGQVTLARTLPEAAPAKALNVALARGTLRGAPYRQVIASALPAVVAQSDVELMLLALSEAQPEPDAAALADQLVDALRVLRRGLKRGEQAVLSREEMLPVARQQVETFQQVTRPRWKDLGVV